MNEYRVKYIETTPSETTAYRKNEYSNGFKRCSMDYINASLDNYFNANHLKDSQMKSLLFERHEDGRVDVLIEYYPDIPITRFITVVEDSFDDALEVFRDTYPYEEILKVELVEDEN